MPQDVFSRPFEPDWRGLMKSLVPGEEPDRVHHVELFADAVVRDAICREFDLLTGLDEQDPFFEEKRNIRFAQFMGYDYVNGPLLHFEFPFEVDRTADTAELGKGERGYVNQHHGPISDWESFEAYPWPDPDRVSTEKLEWLSENLPEDMCLMCIGFSHFAELPSWLLGYETLCYKLFDDRELVAALRDRLLELYEAVLPRVLQFERVRAVWSGDDMGFRSGTLISPDDTREFILAPHKRIAERVHEAGRLYLLHSCGNLEAIMEDLIDDVKIDARHSFEDVIEPVTEAKQRWGDRIGILGGIDVDFLARASVEEVRQRVRETLEVCMPGGGYALGTGNSIANYIPLENAFAMLDEGRRYRP